MCDAQGFIDDNLPLMRRDFKLSDTPRRMRKVLDLFPPLHRLTVAKVLTAWSIRVLSPSYEPVSLATFLLAVPVAQGCWAATFNTCGLWWEAPATQGSEAVAFDLLNRIAYGCEPGARELLHTLARAFVDQPNMRDFLTGAIEREQHACIFIGALRAGRRRQLGAVAVPTAPRDRLRTLLTSGATVPAYTRAIYDGAIGLRRREVTNVVKMQRRDVTSRNLASPDPHPPPPRSPNPS